MPLVWLTTARGRFHGEASAARPLATAYRAADPYSRPLETLTALPESLYPTPAGWPNSKGARA